MSGADLFTATSFYSLAGVATIGLIAYVGSQALLPKNASKLLYISIPTSVHSSAAWQNRFTFIWLAFDAMIHFSFEGSFLYLSTFGRQVNTSIGPFAELCRSTYFPFVHRRDLKRKQGKSMLRLTSAGGSPIRPSFRLKYSLSSARGLCAATS